MTDKTCLLAGTTPVLRSFDETKAREFYADFLGFEIVFEHRFGENFPLYIGLMRGKCFLHITEHYGDACPGAHVRIATANLDDFLEELTAKDYKYAKPGTPRETPWGTREMTITDPAGNRLTFVQEA